MKTHITITIMAALAACRSPTTLLSSPPKLAADCAGGDDTAAVQAAMLSGSCLPPGTYRVDTPEPNASGRRRDAMLSGGVLCGARAAETTVLFRGDAHALYWVGVLDADVHDVRLDSSCLSGTPEQSHLIRLTTSHSVRDARLAHPRRATSAGDAINVVGSLAAPMTGLVIDHVTFESCARFGVQVSRGVANGAITDCAFGDGCAFGSEGAAAVDGLVISHSTFASTSGGLAINAQRLTRLVVSHVALRGRGILLYHCDDCVFERSTVSDLAPAASGDYVGAVNIRDSARGVVIRDVVVTQATNAAAPLISVEPLRPERQADLHDVLIDSCSLTQRTPATFVRALGVDGLRLVNTTLAYEGPTTFPVTSLVAGPSVARAPATVVETTGVVESGNTLAGFPQ